MSDRQTLTRAERLRTLGVIRRLFSEGESRFVYPFRIVWLPAEPPAPGTAGLRILFSVPKKYHKRANRRNLLRRRTKEAYRQQKSLLQLAAPYDIALIYTSREVESYDRIAHAVRKIIDHLNALGH